MHTCTVFCAKVPSSPYLPLFPMCMCIILTVLYVDVYRVLCLECRVSCSNPDRGSSFFVFEFHPRQLIFLWKNDCLGCTVLLCLVVCLTLLASFFLPSSLINMYMYTLPYVYVYMCRTQSWTWRLSSRDTS